MAIAIASTSNVTIANGAGQTISAPAGLTAGDLLIAHITLTEIAGTNNLNSPSGWTAIRSLDQIADTKSYVYWKVATSTEVSGGLTYTTTAEGRNGGALYRITGADTVNPVSGSSVGSATASSFNLAIGLTPTYADSGYLILVSGGGSQTASGYAIATSNPTWTEAYDNGSVSLNMAGAYATRSSTSATGNVSFTMSSNTSNQANLIIINPAQATNSNFFQLF